MIWGSKTGAAYIYEYYSGSWRETKLLASDAAAGDAFGTDVSVDGSYAVVGAPSNIGVPGKHSGAAYIFGKVNGTWTQRARLTHSDADFSDGFGESVDIDGGYVAVGAPFANDKRGHAYVFSGSGSTWTERARLTAFDGAPHDKFGIGIGISQGHVAVGAHLDDDQGTDAGAMYLFEGGGSSWSHYMKHSASDGGSGDRYGLAVDIDGDYALAGAYYQDANSTDDGAAYMYGPALNVSAPLLPVELTSFTGYLEQTQIHLRWETASEIGFDRFVVERSADASVWQSIGVVAASGQIEGSQYRFVDPQPVLGLNYYRLRMVDLDGSEAYSHTVIERLQTSDDLSVSPNPAKELVTFSLGTPRQCCVRDLAGRLLWSSQRQAVQHEMRLSGWAPGIYLVESMSDAGPVIRRFVVQ